MPPQAPANGATMDTGDSGSAFPGWLRRWDSSLAGEESNALFQAFRLRRTQHGRASFRRLDYWLRRDFGPVLSIIIVLSAIYFLRLMPGFDAVVVFALVAAYAAAIAMVVARRMRGSVTTRVPATLLDLLAEHEDSELMREMMLVPASGREVAECLYLENRERIPWFVSAGPCALLVALALWMHVSAMPVFAALAAGFAAAMLGLGVQMGRDMALANMRLSVERFESAHMAEWKQRHLPRYPTDWGLMESAISTVVLLIGAALFQATQPGLGFLAILPALTPGLGAIPIQGRMMRRTEPVIAVAYRRAELVWPAYARNAILKDPPVPEEAFAGQPGDHP